MGVVVVVGAMAVIIYILTEKGSGSTGSSSGVAMERRSTAPAPTTRNTSPYTRAIIGRERGQTLLSGSIGSSSHTSESYA